MFRELFKRNYVKSLTSSIVSPSQVRKYNENASDDKTKMGWGRRFGRLYGSHRRLKTSRGTQERWQKEQALVPLNTDFSQDDGCQDVAILLGDIALVPARRRKSSAGRNIRLLLARL